MNPQHPAHGPHVELVAMCAAALFKIARSFGAG